MSDEAAKDIYKQRAATVECTNAQARNRGLRQFLVRGEIDHQSGLKLRNSQMTSMLRWHSISSRRLDRTRFK